MACMPSLTAVVYSFWTARNKAYWEAAVPVPAKVCSRIKAAICNRIQGLVNAKWKNEELSWFCNLKQNRSYNLFSALVVCIFFEA